MELKEQYRLLDAFLKMNTNLEMEREKIENSIAELKKLEFDASVKMAMQAAAQLHGFAVKPLEQSAAAIVEAEKQAIKEALCSLPSAVEQVDYMATSLRNAVSATKIKALIIGGVALAAFAVGLGGGAYFGWQFVAQSEDAKLQKIEDAYKTTNQSLNILARCGVGLTATEDDKGVYIGVPYVAGGEMYRSKDNHYMVLHLPSKP